jgi:hypothetical protein
VAAEAREQEAAADTFEIHEDNVLVLSAFLALQTQWRIVAGGMSLPVYQGLDYAAIPVVLDSMRIRRSDRPDMIVGLRTMESAALPVLNRRRDED